MRRLGPGSSSRFLFQGKALTLQSIGMGYGKRITFEGESLNFNSNYFYSDSCPTGFGFSLVAVEENAVFNVTEVDSDHPVAEACVVDITSQREIDTDVTDCNIVKKVAITFTCFINYLGDQHGLMPLYSRDRLRTTAIAYIVKNRKSRKANTTAVENIELPHYGLVTFNA